MVVAETAARQSIESMLVQGEFSLLEAHWVSPDDPPVLMVHRDQDPTVPLEQSDIFLSALSEMGVPSELVVVENGGHGFNDMTGPIDPGFAEITQIVSDFFDSWLGD